MAQVVQFWKRHTSQPSTRLGLSSCTRPGADYKSALPGGLPSCPRPGADYKSALPADNLLAH
ncbi:hypothetical protein [Prochlorothrix hollandica]|uniref:hypothetical protein n=1 Tax=Prochlorothrix hollandica TaxID=1223 RepID=UPI003341943F